MVRFEVIMAGTALKMTIFSDVTPPFLTDVYRRFGGICDLHLQAAKYPSTLKIEITHSSQTLVNIYQDTRRHILEDWN
jgi:hypothetical protein